jgi:hypothetical protein
MASLCFAITSRAKAPFMKLYLVEAMIVVNSANILCLPSTLIHSHLTDQLTLRDGAWTIAVSAV